MLVCVFLQFCTRDGRCSAHPAFPAPSDFKGTRNSGKTRAQSRGEIARPCLYAAGCLKSEVGKLAPPSLRANGSRECAPDDRLRIEPRTSRFPDVQLNI